MPVAKAWAAGETCSRAAGLRLDLGVRVVVGLASGASALAKAGEAAARAHHSLPAAREAVGGGAVIASGMRDECGGWDEAASGGGGAEGFPVARGAGAAEGVGMEEKRNLVLASGSPRRRELLTEAGYDFETAPADIDELHEEAMALEALTRHNAVEKARVVAGRRAEAVVLAADTLVAIGGVALTKPVDMAEARRMIGMLAGRTHEVVTAVAVVCAATGFEEVFTVETRVTFKGLREAEVEEYLGLINPLDKAGGYAAQEHGERIIERVDGSWTNVVGLPMEETAAALARAGVTGK